MNAPNMNGYQVRTERTKAQLLVAAEEIFARDGFEGAQMEEIAKAAGRSKGAIYAHYKSKDDLFLALAEHRTTRFIATMFDAVLQCSTQVEAVAAFKKALMGRQNSTSWIVLNIEAKLYALRHPEMRERWLQASSTFHSEEYRSRMQWDRLTKALFGDITTSQRVEIEGRLAAAGPIINGLVLEAEFEPKILSKKRIAALTDELFDVLLRVPK